MSEIVSFAVPLLAGRSLVRVESGSRIYRPAGMDRWILQFTLEGKGLANRDHSPFEIKPGDALLFAPRVLHDYSVAEDSTGDWVHLWVYFDPRPEWEGLKSIVA
ncbi:MAG: AraC family ligand binding domain-containing protein [Planctomycetes bacterium]|nr:AraC family ligand binding domain-containing protein [Planctomycetota bacterium]